MTRTPVRSYYDAIVDLLPATGIAEQLLAVVKLTYRIVGNELKLAEPEPLFGDMRDETLQPRMPTGSDFWFFKTATDVVVRGKAMLPRPAAHGLVTITTGTRSKRIALVGPRRASYDGHRVRFSEPDRFTQMPLDWEHAYGGCDPRVPVPTPGSPLEAMALKADHPGLYPRNPNGRGYVVVPEPCDDVELPNLEDPDDRLTPERFVVGDPRAWWKQPLPVCPDFLPMLWFPRYVHMGLDAWFPAPDDVRMPEVQRGHLPGGYRAYFDQVGMQGHDQEAVPDLRFAELAPGTPVVVTGMHPQGKPVGFALPPAPAMALLLEGERHEPRPRLTTLVVEPNEERVMLTYVISSATMHRKFVPGAHGDIPLALQVGRDTPIEYVTPKPRYRKSRGTLGDA